MPETDPQVRQSKFDIGADGFEVVKPCLVTKRGRKVEVVHEEIIPAGTPVPERAFRIMHSPIIVNGQIVPRVRF